MFFANLEKMPNEQTIIVNDGEVIEQGSEEAKIVDHDLIFVEKEKIGCLSG